MVFMGCMIGRACESLKQENEIKFIDIIGK